MYFVVDGYDAIGFDDRAAVSFRINLRASLEDTVKPSVVYGVWSAEKECLDGLNLFPEVLLT